MNISRKIFSVLLVTLFWIGPVYGTDLLLKAGSGMNWYKGQTHTHTLWSDGDAAPDYVVNWYKESGYNFIAITDHNTMLIGDRWVPVGFESLVSEITVKDLREKLGEDWVETREVDGKTEMRLKNMKDLKARFDERGSFELLWGEEITSISPQVHVNGINVRRQITPSFGNYKDQGIRENIQKVEEQSKKFAIPMFAHLDHPNWNQAVSAEDILSAGNVQFFELYNGHAGVRNWGNEKKHLVPTDKLWDIMLSVRLAAGKPIVYGVGTDDAHSYYEMRIGNDNPFRGWCMVLAPQLTSGELVNAYKTGRFYVSTGVLLEEIKANSKTFSVTIETRPGAKYTTQFIGTPKGTNTESTPKLDSNGKEIRGVTGVYDDSVGQVLFETNANPAVYTLKGNELYVRAKIVSDVIQDNPHKKGDLEMAWTQPYVE
jgi:hypothetical protein